MASFDMFSIVGGTDQYRGSKFDDFETLINCYLSLLIESLVRNGITYSTGRNATLAKIEIDSKKGFVNYVQPFMGKWDYNDPKYQRIVSPEFVIFIFNNGCLIDSYVSSFSRGEILNQQIKFNSHNQSIDGTFFKDLNIETIIDKKMKYQQEYYKKQQGEPSTYDSINSDEIGIVNTLYELIRCAIKYSKKFADFQTELKEADAIRRKIDEGIVDWDSLTDAQFELCDNVYEDDEHYMSLENLNNSIRGQVVKHLAVMKKHKTSGSITEFEDPISFTIEEPEQGVDYFSDDQYYAIVDYSTGKEFNANNVIDVNHLKK